MKNREEITKEIIQKAKQWDEKSNYEKFDHVDDHLVKAREEFENAKRKIERLTREDIIHPIHRARFSKVVIDLQERILIDLEDDIRLFMEQDNEENEDEGKLIEVVD